MTHKTFPPTASSGTASTNGGGAFVNSDGAEPGPLTLSGDMLYGTAKSGGSMGAGILFYLRIAPRIDIGGPGTGLQPGGLSFNVVGCSNQVVGIEASVGLTEASWVTLGTNTIGAGPVQFVDPGSTNCPRRFYRLQMW